jgi:type VI secretion system protein ImpF
MERLRAEHDLVPSVLDRLIDNAPDVSTEPPVNRSVRVAQVKESVKRDLEWLLNTKRAVTEIPADLRQLHASLLTFGMPDFTHSSINRPDDKRALQQAVEIVVRRFEPRLKEVAVTLLEARDFDRGLRFRIDAKLDIEPAPEAVSFDSVLDLNSKSFAISAG